MSGLRSYFYDRQIRRYLIQFMRMFSTFQYMYLNTNGEPTLSQIPITYGDPSRQAAAVTDDNSQSTVQTVPQFAVIIRDLKYNQERLQDATFQNTMNIRQRHWDPASNSFTMNQGVDYNVQRRMPVPWDLTLELDLWTSNTDQKLQILEQIIPLFNPSFDIQRNDNYVDWASLTWVQLLDTTWTSRSVPIGTDNPIDIATLTFRMPIWISPPARVTEMGIIQTIVANIYQDNGDLIPELVDGDILLSRQYITPLQYGLVYSNGILTCLRENDIATNTSNLQPSSKIGLPEEWHNVINLYGTLRPGVSQIKLVLPDNATEVVGTIAYNPSNDTQLIFTPINNTLPVNDFEPVNNVINPQAVAPSEGLPAASTGQRYLLTMPIGDTSAFKNPTIWGQLIANANDIIQYNGTNWYVAFNSEENSAPTMHYMIDLTTNVQLEWDGSGWAKATDGFYGPGSWQIYL